MKQANWFLLIFLAASLATGPSAFAAEQADQAAQAEATAQASTKSQSEKAEALVQAEYQRAIAEANRSRSEANAAVAEARAELAKVDRQQHESQRQISEERRVEIEAMRQKLNLARQDLRESTRELSQVNRELMIVTQSGAERQIIISGAGNPVIGVALGDTTGVGVAVLGVSPNGPAERAGLQPGDVIIAVDGVALSGEDASGDAREGLNSILSDLEAFEPLILSVERDQDSLDLMVVPEVLKPLSWQSVVRFPPAPPEPGKPPAAPSPAAHPENFRVERIAVQELDRDALAEQIRTMEMEIEQRGHHQSGAPGAGGEYENYFIEMSELGDIALSDTNAWYGMPLTSGLRLAQIDPDLGEYFNTRRGVLVLKAKPDNALLLQTGDVVLDMLGIEVNSPEEFMRALRKLTPGEAVQIEIKRKRKDQTLSPVISDEQAQLLAPQHFRNHQVIVSDNDQSFEFDLQAKLQ